MLFICSEKTPDGANGKCYDSDYFSSAVKESLSGYMDYEKQSLPLRMNFRNLLSQIHRHMPFNPNQSLLDVGCAYGFLLDEARKLGMSVHGVDVSENAIQWMEKNLGIKGTVGFSCDAPMGPFDLITAVEVIEHVKDPYSFLSDLYMRLAAGGILAVHTGASDTRTARLLGRRWWYLNPPDHCSVFSRSALKKLITDGGFDILDHSLTSHYWVGLNNMFLKLARILESRQLGYFASKCPVLAVPVFHFSTQLMIAKKR